MIKLSTVLYTLFFAKLSPAQISDSTSNTSRNFIESNWEKHNHIINFNFVSFEPATGALGYNYLFKPFEKLKFGPRIGLWYRKPGKDIPSNSARNSLTYSFDAILNYSIWKFINAEFSTGYSSYYSWASSTNTANNNSYIGSPFFNQKIGLNLMFISHFALNIGSGICIRLHSQELVY